MLERLLAEHFNKLFNEYQIWTPSNRTAGWPDKGVQVNNSRIIWFELKMVEHSLDAPIFKVKGLEPEQAAWLAKWQREGGFCYLFLGFRDINGRLLKYGVMRVSHWSMWLKVPISSMNISQLTVYTDNMNDVYTWFKDMFSVSKYTRNDYR